MSQRHPTTPAQALGVVLENSPDGRVGRLVRLGPQPWRRGKGVVLDLAGGLLHMPYGSAYTDDAGNLQVLVVTIQFDVDNRMSPP